MNEVIELVRRHGYQLVFASVFFEALGLPLPSAIILVAAGALSTLVSLKIYWVIASGIAGMMLGDLIMYWLGRRTGWFILGIICRLSLNPEACIVKSANTFYRRGKITLLFSKFVPGINAISTPLAGSLKMRLSQFVGLDSVGVSLYITCYALVGFLFSRELARIARGLASVQRLGAWVIGALVAFYFFHRLRTYFKSRSYSNVPYVSVQELKEKLQREKECIVLCDVRSHGYYESDAKRIPGSIRLEPASMAQAVKTLPRDKEIYLYCT